MEYFDTIDDVQPDLTCNKDFVNCLLTLHVCGFQAVEELASEYCKADRNTRKEKLHDIMQKVSPEAYEIKPSNSSSLEKGKDVSNRNGVVPH